LLVDGDCRQAGSEPAWRFDGINQLAAQPQLLLAASAAGEIETSDGAKPGLELDLMPLACCAKPADGFTGCIECLAAEQNLSGI